MKFVITKYRDGILRAGYQQDQLVSLNFDREAEQSLVGNIYVGRVKDIVPNLDAAFIEIAPGVPCYYSMEDHHNPIYVRKSSKKKALCAGDELLVQVVKDAVKTKAPVVTANLSITGSTAVVTTGRQIPGVSRKIKGDVREQLMDLAKEHSSGGSGVVIRTNAAGVPADVIAAEIQMLQEACTELITYAAHRPCYTLVRKAEAPWLTELRGLNSPEIITDLPEVCEMIRESSPGLAEQLRLYQDEAFPLYKLYSLETALREAMQEKVWLKCGGYLVIEPTEALTVIDVNTGKYSKKQSKEKTVRTLNLEAAAEIARQLRIRNLSGIIIVDFVNHTNRQYQEELLEHFRKLLRSDPVKTTLIGMTTLQLVEITRQKIRKSLKEQFHDKS